MSEINRRISSKDPRCYYLVNFHYPKEESAEFNIYLSWLYFHSVQQYENSAYEEFVFGDGVAFNHIDACPEKCSHPA